MHAHVHPYALISLFFFFLLKTDNVLTNYNYAILQYYTEMLESGIFVRDFGTHQEEINLVNSGTWTLSHPDVLMCNLFWLNLLFTFYYSSLPVWNAYLIMNLKIVTVALRWQPRLNIHS